MTDRYTADTINDDVLDELYRRIATLEHVAAGNKRHVQLIVPELEACDAARRELHGRVERAETAITRVRALAARIRQGVPWTANDDDIAAHILAALDGPGPEETDTTHPEPDDAGMSHADEDEAGDVYERALARVESAVQQRDQFAATLRELLGRFEPAFPSMNEPMRYQATISIEERNRWRAIAEQTTTTEEN